ncbi:MAG: hypothetical protein ACYS26_13820 [Planctomycetota bacterium]|jgi:hypothetical protein
MKTSRLLSPALLVALGACQGVDIRRDDHPLEGDAKPPQSTLWLGVPEQRLKLEGTTASMVVELSNGSAVALDDDLLLTAMHVWSNEAEIVGSPQQCQHFLGLQRDSAIERSPSPDPHFDLKLEGTALIEAAAHLESSGYEPETGLAQDQQESQESLRDARDRLGQDWAVARVDEPWWPAEQVATLHDPALDPDWSPAEDVPLYALGFAAFFGEAGAHHDSLFHLDQFVSAGPYTVAGLGLGPDRAGFMDYPDARPIPKGHSGGGIYVWNKDAEHMELVGILSSCLEFRTPSVVRPLGLFGVEALSFELPNAFDTSEKLVVFVPLARILEALPEDLRAEIMRANALEA